MISGKVVGGDADLMLGGMAVIWAKPASGTRYTPVGSTYLFGDNVDMYSVSVMPAEQTRYIVQFAGNASYEALVSTAYLDVKVKWKLAIKASASSAKLNAKVTFSGSVGPNGDGLGHHREGESRRHLQQGDDGHRRQRRQLLEGSQDGVEGHVTTSASRSLRTPTHLANSSSVHQGRGQVGPHLPRRACPVQSDRRQRAAPRGAALFSSSAGPA